MSSDVRTLIDRWRADPGGTYQTWFLWDERLKNFRSMWVVETEANLERILKILARELPLKQAAALAAEITGEKKNRLYDMALAEHARTDE